VIEYSAIAVLDDSEQIVSNNFRGAEVVSFELDIFDKVLRFDIGVTNKQARLSDIVPLARTISSRVAVAVLDTLNESGQIVPCCKGCSACCEYLIPLSIPEVFRLHEELLTMPVDRGGRYLAACLEKAETILGKGSGEFGAKEQVKYGQFQKEQLSQWYSGLKIACPFLSDGICSLYSQRPMACREHIITGSAFFCSNNVADEPAVFRMPVSVLDCLGQLAADLEQSEIEAVMLPLALPWVRDNLDRYYRNWPALTMVEHFVKILKLTAAENSSMFGSLN